MISFKKKQAAIVTVKEVDRILTTWARSEFGQKATAVLEEGSECDSCRIVLKTPNQNINSAIDALYQKYLNRPPEPWERFLPPPGQRTPQSIGMVPDGISFIILVECLSSAGLGFKPSEFLRHPATKPELLVVQ